MDDIPLSTQFIALGVLLLISGFFSISETSMMAINRYRLRAMAQLGQRGAKLTMELLARTDRLLSVILLGNTLVNSAAAVLASIITAQLFNDNDIATGVSTVVVTFLLLVFSEITPKIIGARYPEKIAPMAAFVLQPLLRVLYPITWFVNLFVQSLLWIVRLKPALQHDTHLTTEELRTLVLEAGNFIPKKHQSILFNLFELESITVDDVMTPRNQIESIDLDSSSEELHTQITTAHHRRLAVYEEQPDNIVGVVIVRKLLSAADGEVTAELIREQMHAPLFVPVGTPLFTQLQQFQEQRDRVCFVVDEYGELQGMVTLEDIIEELIGEFATHSPLQATEFRKQDDGSYLIEGSTPLRTLNRKLGSRFPLDGPKTLNGLILEHLQDIPEPDTSLKIEDYLLEILQTQSGTIKVVRLTPPAQKEMPAE